MTVGLAISDSPLTILLAMITLRKCSTLGKEYSRVRTEKECFKKEFKGCKNVRV